MLRKSRPELSILAISGSFEGEFLHTAKLLGVQETLLKPFKGSILLKTAEAALVKQARPALL